MITVLTTTCPHTKLLVLLTIFFMLYITSPWLIYFITKFVPFNLLHLLYTSPLLLPSFLYHMSQYVTKGQRLNLHNFNGKQKKKLRLLQVVPIVLQLLSRQVEIHAQRDFYLLSYVYKGYWNYYVRLFIKKNFF